MPVPNGDVLVLKSLRDPEVILVIPRRQPHRLIPVGCPEQPEQMTAN